MKGRGAWLLSVQDFYVAAPTPDLMASAAQTKKIALATSANAIFDFI